MIYFARAEDKNDKTSLFIGVKASYPLEQTVWFKRVCSSEIERNLLEVHLSTALRNSMEEIRKTLYRIGWKHKASHKSIKWDSFSPGTSIEEYEKSSLR